MAEGFMWQAITENRVAERIACDSAGLIGYHAGSPPDQRAQKMMRSLGIDISGQRSRPLVDADLSVFDYLVAMDEGHHQALLDACSGASEDSAPRIVRMLDFVEGYGSEVPDPYYGEYDGFVEVAEMLQPAIRALLHSVLNPTQRST